MELDKDNNFDLPLYTQTSDLDFEEGDVINEMKANNIKELPVDDLTGNKDLKKSAFVTSVDFLLNWARKSSIFPAQFGLACCAFNHRPELAGACVYLSFSVLWRIFGSNFHKYGRPTTTQKKLFAVIFFFA